MSKRKPVLFLDFDGLKFETLDIHVRYINQKYGIQTTRADYKNNPQLELIIRKYLPNDCHHLVTNESAYTDVGLNLNASFDWHADVPPIEGMTEILPLLAKKYTLWTVTARQTVCRPVVEHLLNIHIPGCISGVHFVWENLENNKFKERSKREFIQNFTGDKIAFIDDSANEILQVQDIIPSYLFDPERINDDINEIQNRVRNWKQIGEMFL